MEILEFRFLQEISRLFGKKIINIEVNIVALKRGIVKLEAYNKNWKKEYQKEEKILKDILKDKIIEIEIKPDAIP